ncbi:hypothetical protein FACS1894199_02990 [Bacteroidia bacterium]|nr:hypothetical protein FACS1894199_02990 [Bacteroidia bacterium]
MKQIMNFKLSAIQKEWLMRGLMVVLFVGVPTLADAQAKDAGLETIGSAIRSMVTTAITTIVLVVAVVRAGMIGIAFASKDSEERGEEDSKKLKSGLLRIGIGTAIALGANLIGNFFAKMVI